MRPFNEDGSWGIKQKKEYILDENGNKIYDPAKRQYQCRSIPSTDWNKQTKADEWREAWADYLNAEFARNGIEKRVDHRSYARQGIEQIPTVHLGVSVTQMERRGIITDRGNINREIAVTNSQIRQLRARINKVKDWLDENKANTPPTLLELLNAMLRPGADKTQWEQIFDVKLAAKTLAFVQNNDVSDLLALADKVNAIQRDCNDALDRKKKAERRIKTLDKHSEQSENFKKYRKVRAAYDKLYANYKALSKETGLFAKSKAQKALDAANEYYDVHRSEIAIYDAAEKYLRGVMQKHFDPAKLPPITAWRRERETCAQELGGINTEYKLYKNDVENAEAMKRFAVELMIPDEPQERKKTKTLEVSI
jgi:flagellar motility protein MotE (MotC chaperone)